MKYITILLLATLSGCSVFTTTPESKYGTSSQGIPVSQLEVNKLKPGMHKKQVANLIGHPPHINPFSPDTWTYFHMKHGITNPESLVLTFKNNKLTTIRKTPALAKKDQKNTPKLNAKKPKSVT